MDIKEFYCRHMNISNKPTKLFRCALYRNNVIERLNLFLLILIKIDSDNK